MPAAAADQIDVAETGRFGDTYTGVRAPRLQSIADDLAGWPDEGLWDRLVAMIGDATGLEIRDLPPGIRPLFRHWLED